MDTQQRQNFVRSIEAEGRIENRFSNIKGLNATGGGGHFSVIFVAFDEKTQKEVALKFYDPSKMGVVDRLDRFEREAKILTCLKNEEMIVDIIDGQLKYLSKQLTDNTGFTYEIRHPFFVLDLADNNIEEFIYYSTDTNALMNLSVFKEMVKSVFRLHDRKICHRDLKPDNFLIKRQKILLSDLGTAKIMDKSMPDIRSQYVDPVGHRLYWAPELHFGIGIADELVYQADIFALGAILFEMFTQNIYTTQIFDKTLFRNFEIARNLLAKMTHTKKDETIKLLIKDLSKMIKTPDIYAYNGNIPGCIRNRLNKLYKDLVHIDSSKRLNNPLSIFRQLNICIITLKNETKYQNWLAEKRRRRLIRLNRKNHHVN